MGALAGLRNHLVHVYEEVDDRIVHRSLGDGLDDLEQLRPGDGAPGGAWVRKGVHERAVRPPRLDHASGQDLASLKRVHDPECVFA